MTDTQRAKILPFYALRLKHLVRPRACLLVECVACRRGAEAVEVLPLIGTRGPDQGVRELKDVLRCRNCNQQGWAFVTVQWLEGER